MLKATAKSVLVLALALGVAGSGALRFYGPPKKSCCGGQCPMEQRQQSGPCCSPTRAPDSRIAEPSFQPSPVAVFAVAAPRADTLDAAPRPVEPFSSPPIAFLHAPTGLSPPAA